MPRQTLCESQMLIDRAHLSSKCKNWQKATKTMNKNFIFKGHLCYTVCVCICACLHVCTPCLTGHLV